MLQFFAEIIAFAKLIYIDYFIGLTTVVIHWTRTNGCSYHSAISKL